MQIEKINNNKLEILLSIDDLKDNNIDVHSFLSNSSETQNFFFDILDLAREKYDFTIEEDKFIVESINLNENLFLVTITKLLSDSILNSSDDVPVIYTSNSFENFYAVLDLLKKYNIKKYCTVYNYSNLFFYVFNKKPSKNISNILSEYCTYEKYTNCINNILLEHGKLLKIK